MKYGIAVFGNGAMVKLAQVCGINPVGPNSCRVYFHGGGDMHVPCSALDMSRYVMQWFDETSAMYHEALDAKTPLKKGEEDGPERTE